MIEILLWQLLQTKCELSSVLFAILDNNNNSFHTYFFQSKIHNLQWGKYE